MQIVLEQATRMRALAAHLRDNAMCTILPEYREIFARTADELDDLARQLERRARFHLAS